MKVVNIGGWEFVSDPMKGFHPYFSNEIRRRVNKKLACNVIVTGEAGISKSYTAIDMARTLDPKMTVKQIVLSYKGYYDVLLSLKMGKPIVFDEPSYSLSAREWYKEINRALVQTVESQRSLVKPLFIPIINMNLIDKTIRMYLVQFHIHMVDHGRGMVYRTFASQYESKVYRYFLCRIVYGLGDRDKCPVESCLDCKKLETCDIFRAKYERKKLGFQMQRYTQDRDEAQRMESSQLTDRQIATLAYKHKERFTDSDSHIDVNRLRITLAEEEGVRLGFNKGYHIRAFLEYHYKEFVIR